jgi:hypothetical protein
MKTVFAVLYCSIIVSASNSANNEIADGIITSDDVCASLTTSSDEFWNAVTSCSPCVRKGCGYCLSTLQCMGGDERGPSPGSMPCPKWVWADDKDCPVIPECSTLLTCNDCAQHEMCAWCAADKKCMTAEETYFQDCRGVVFDAPCPASHTPGIPNNALHSFHIHIHYTILFSSSVE